MNLTEREQEIEEALCKALQGKWERTGEGWFNVPNCAKIVVKDEWGQTYVASIYAGSSQEANAHLIANAPEWLRYQQSLIQQLREEREDAIREGFEISKAGMKTFDTLTKQRDDAQQEIEQLREANKQQAEEIERLSNGLSRAIQLLETYESQQK